MTNPKSSTEYTTPELTEYGPVESMTEAVNKEGNQEDIYSPNTPLVGSTPPAG
jgi:hypothetical protein